MKTRCYSDSETQTRAVGEALARFLVPDGVLLLSGDLGSGKTVLTQGLAAGLGIEPKEVQSPTFTLIREHQGLEGDLIHIDLYRLEAEELEVLGLWEILAGPGVKAVEWAERLSFEVAGALRVDLRVPEPGNRRQLEFSGTGWREKIEEALRTLGAAAR